MGGIIWWACIGLVNFLFAFNPPYEGWWWLNLVSGILCAYWLMQAIEDYRWERKRVAY